MTVAPMKIDDPSLLLVTYRLRYIATAKVVAVADAILRLQMSLLDMSAADDNDVSTVPIKHDLSIN